MKSINVAVVGTISDELQKITAELPKKEYSFDFSVEAKEVVSAIEQRDINFVLVDSNMENDGISLCRSIRGKYYGTPIEIIAIVDSENQLEEYFDAGADDVVIKPIRKLELKFRLQAAGIRFKQAIRLLDERDFFKKAVKQEEQLASKILDHHLVLKDAFQNIESINEELEATNRRLEKVAKYDLQSGLLNRVTLFASIDMEIERAIRTNMPLSGIMMDIDKFKSINDEYGHLCGDEVIAAIGKRLGASLRKYDHAGRYGGEEFFIILPNTTVQQAYMIAERFRKELQDTVLHCDEVELRITASFGIAHFGEGDNREMWISRADKNMYIAKQNGRNRVISENTDADSGFAT